MRFDQALPYSIDFVLPGYEKSYPQGTFKALAFSPLDSKTWYQQFAEKLEGSIGKGFLPLYRMSDGEYEFCVGYRVRLRMAGEPRWLYLLRVGRILLQRARHMALRGGVQLSPGKGLNWQSGSYSSKEVQSLRPVLIDQVRQISQEGILSLVFTYRETQFAQQYFLPMARWFQQNHISLCEQNYYPFYFMYALLNGPERHRFFRDRNILVVTHLTPEKQAAIESTLLLKENAKKVQFISISPNRSMFDQVHLEDIVKPVDLVLVGAGLGSCNILLQLRSLNTLTMDVGYVIECLANPERKKQRTFCWPDEERDGNYTPV